MPGTDQTNHEEQYRILLEEILNFVHRPGDLISESQLCQRFGLSRTPARSILQRLQENGLVQIEPKKGTTVTRLNLDIVNQLIYERIAVETMVLRDFVRTRTPADVEKIRYYYVQMQEAGKNYHADPEHFDARAFNRADMAMHSAWFRQMNMDYVWQRLSSPQSSYTRFCMLDILAGDNVPDVLAEHAEMLSLIEDQREEAIEPLLRRHLYGGVRRLKGMLFTRFGDYLEPIEGEGGIG